VKVEGVDLTPTVLHPSELFWRQASLCRIRRRRDVDVVADDGEVEGRRALVGIPVFTTRMFFHTRILVRKDAKIDKPADLKGNASACRNTSRLRRCGFAARCSTSSAVEPKDIGILDGTAAVEEPRRRHRLQGAARRDGEPGAAR